MKQYDVVVVGGGFFGCSLALHLKTFNARVLLLEKESALMTHASYNNQARVHGGYHYSRSLLTALRSQVNFKDFVSKYEACIDSTFEKYYAIGRYFSKVSARHFRQFCERIGASISSAPKEVTQYFNDNLVEDVFTVREYAFDSLKLRKLITERLDSAAVEYWLNTEAESFTHNGKGKVLRIKNAVSGKEEEIGTARIFNCTYAHINKLNYGSKLPLIPFKHELTEMALIKVPDTLQKMGVTIMDGPFFSTMPFPSRGLHTLSHVRYTPHVAWNDGEGKAPWRNGHAYLKQHKPPSAFQKMLADAQRYIPLLAQSQYVDSLWEVKTLLPKSEGDDSRPILFVPAYAGVDGYSCVMGGKIDNVQDVLKEVDILYGR